MKRPRLEPETQFLLLAAAIGAVGALGNLAFRAAIGLAHGLFVEGSEDLVRPIQPGLGPFLIVLVPIAGGLIVGLIGKLAKAPVGGYALPAFLETVNLRAAELKIRRVALRTLAAIVTLGSGGSSGVEGPIATLGGAIGAGVARTRRIAGERLRLLVACGASAAVAAAYGAPIAGVFFTQEIVLAGNYDLQNFVRVVVASGTATVVARALRGDEPLFEVTPFELESGSELVSYLALGVGCGLLAVMFARVFFATRDLFERSRIPTAFRPAVGGLLVGLLALASPGVLGDGVEVIQEMLERTGSPGWGGLALLGVLCVAKVVATSSTLGSGGAGGVFGPSLFLGAVLGAAVGSISLELFPDRTGLPGHYAIVGMGALLAGTARAPLTAIFLVFEMTGSSSTAVLPTLIAVAASLLVARRLEPDSIDEMALARRGIRLKDGREAVTLSAIKVREAMAHQVERVPAGTPAPELQRLINRSRRNAFIVVDDEGRMTGILGLQDLRILDQQTAESLGQLTIASDLAESKVMTALADESLSDALARMDLHGYRQLPVVEAADPRRVVGMLERRHVIHAYRRALVGGGDSSAD